MRVASAALALLAAASVCIAAPDAAPGMTECAALQVLAVAGIARDDDAPSGHWLRTDRGAGARQALFGMPVGLAATKAGDADAKAFAMALASAPDASDDAPLADADAAMLFVCTPFDVGASCAVAYWEAEEPIRDAVARLAAAPAEAGATFFVEDAVGAVPAAKLHGTDGDVVGTVEVRCTESRSVAGDVRSAVYVTVACGGADAVSKRCDKRTAGKYVIVARPAPAAAFFAGGPVARLLSRCTWLVVVVAVYAALEAAQWWQQRRPAAAAPTGQKLHKD